MSTKLKKIFSSLQPNDVIGTSGGKFVVCREISGTPENKQSRYVLGQLCECETHCENILLYSFAWDDATGALTDAKGTPLPGWNNDANVDRGAYRGEDKGGLGFILVVDELPIEFDDTDDARRGELVVLARTLRDIARLSPNERTMWHSTMTVLGSQMSEVQLIALSSAFGPSKNPGMLLAATIVGVAMASGMFESNGG